MQIIAPELSLGKTDATLAAERERGREVGRGEVWAEGWRKWRGLHGTLGLIVRDDSRHVEVHDGEGGGHMKQGSDDESGENHA